MTLPEMLETYFDLAKKIHEFFGYQEDWKTIPLDNQLEQYWMLFDDKVAWAPTPFTEELIEAGMELYSAEIYTQRHLPKFVYRANGYTMISADTQCDGNKYLMVFDDKLECRDESLKELYREHW